MTSRINCCDWFVSFFRRKTSKNKEINPISINPGPTENLNNRVDDNSRNFVNQLIYQSIQNENKNINLNFPIIKTNFNNDDLISLNTPDKDKDIRYNCPICLKFYNHIFVLSCCKNYLCLRCTNNYTETSKKYKSQVKCPICNYSDQLFLEDVNPYIQIKYYTDSACVTIKKTLKRIETIKEENIELIPLKNSFKIINNKLLISRKSKSFDVGIFHGLNLKKQLDLSLDIKKHNINNFRRSYRELSINYNRVMKDHRQLKSPKISNNNKASKFKKNLNNSDNVADPKINLEINSLNQSLTIKSSNEIILNVFNEEINKKSLIERDSRDKSFFQEINNIIEVPNEDYVFNNIIEEKENKDFSIDNKFKNIENLGGGL